MVGPLDCPECGAEVWPSSLDHAQRWCENWGALVKLIVWPEIREDAKSVRSGNLADDETMVVRDTISESLNLIMPTSSGY